MNKFLSFLYKFSSVIMMIIGVLVSLILAAITGVRMTGQELWTNPSVEPWTVVVFSIAVGGLALSTIFGFFSIFFKSAKWLSKFGKFIIMTIAFVILLVAAIFSGQTLSATTGWSEFNSAWAKALISIFSISVIIISMNFVFGIVTANYRMKLKKQSKEQNNQSNY